MRLLRTLLLFLALASALAAIVVALAFVPAVQTWLVERALAGRPGLQVSVGSVSAGLSRVHVANLRMQHDRVVLTLPVLDATLPVKTALWDRQAHIRTLVAKGWTLDLSGLPPASAKNPRTSVAAPTQDRSRATATPPPDSALAQKIVSEFRGLLGGWSLPCDLSLDGVDVEGDVLLPPLAGTEPTRVRVTLKGGGLASGRSGEFALDASGPMIEPVNSPGAVTSRGRLVVAMNSPRTFHRIALTGQVSATDGSLPDALELSAEIVASGPTRAERYLFDLRRGERHLATLNANRPAASPRLTGTWKIELHDSDVARLARARTFPGFAAAGEGSFDADASFTHVHAVGHLQTALNHLGNFAPALDRLGAVSLAHDFDAVLTGHTLQIERLTAQLDGTRPIGSAHTVQPFVCDLRTGEIKVKESTVDWLEGSLQGLPLAWLSGLVDGLALTGGDATGDFAVTAVGGKFALRSRAPLVATGVTVQRADQVLAQGLDLSLTLLAEPTPKGWQFQTAPLVVNRAGRRLATIGAKLSPLTEPRLRYAVAGTWDADLAALGTLPALAAFGSLPGRATTGDFSVRVGVMTEVKSTIKLAGHTSDRSATVGVRAYVDAFGGVSFKVPITLTFGSNATTVTADGQWTKEKSSTRLEAGLSGVDGDLAHLRLLAGALASWGGVPWPVLSKIETTPSPTLLVKRDQHPFWGEWVGRVKFDFYRLRTGTQEWNEITGTLGLDRSTLRLEGGRAVLAPPLVAQPVINRGPIKGDPPRNRLSAEGTLAFDAAAEFPYRLKATTTIDAIDAARLFTPAQAEHGPVIEGRFTFADTLTADGLNLQNLIDRRQEEFRLTGKNGIVRLLKADVAAAIPENPTLVKDTFTKVGSLVGALFGVRKSAIDSPVNHLSPATQAVLDFAYQTPEIRYDELSLIAVRGSDHVIHLHEIGIDAPNVQLTGSGEIGCVKDRPLRAQPIVLDLKFGFKGRSAQLLTTAELLSSEKNAQGYTLLREPVHFAGSLEQIDNTAWRDLLVKAATATPGAGKKDR